LQVATELLARARDDAGEMPVSIVQGSRPIAEVPNVTSRPVLEYRAAIATVGG
jgi:hypothetical protein